MARTIDPGNLHTRRHTLDGAHLGLDTTIAAAAARTVHRAALDHTDAALLLAMLGLDHAQVDA